MCHIQYNFQHRNAPPGKNVMQCYNHQVELHKFATRGMVNFLILFFKKPFKNLQKVLHILSYVELWLYVTLS